MPELLLELFSEEIPARMQARASEDLARLVTDGLKKAGLAFGKVDKFAAPRRIGLAIADIPAARPDVREERRGPRVGAPEQALQGFLKSAGLASIAQCETRDVKGAEYYFAVIEKKGGASVDSIGELVADTIAGFPWPKSMRWGQGTLRWVRPLHGVLCVFDGKPIPYSFSIMAEGEQAVTPEIEAQRVVAFSDKTQGHRFLAPGEIRVTSFDDYKKKLRKASVIVDPAERRERIRQEARALATAEDLTLTEDDALLDEVTGLVDWPVPLLGRIDADSMALPPEVLITSMRAHQKYFALETPEREMAPHFLVIANMITPDGGAAITAGNERVLRARLADARFFWETDRKVRLEDRVKALDTITFHAKLGTSGEKVRRITELAAEIAKRIPGGDVAKVRRAAQLSKADLTTGMVGEFPELQGVMGRYYAIHDNEDADVANAIAEHWGPLGPSDTCPKAPVSVAVALSDKIDSLVGFFVIGEAPTGSKDPYALRRAALGIIRLIVENNLRVDLGEIIAAAYNEYVEQNIVAVIQAFEAKRREMPSNFPHQPNVYAYHHLVQIPLQVFFADRLRVQFRERGIRHDLISALVAGGVDFDLVRLLARVEALRGFIESDDGKNLLVAYRRAANIVKIEAKKNKIEKYGEPDAGAYKQPEEKALAAALDKLATESGALIAKEDFAGAMRLLAGLRAPVDAFFEKVTVNAPEKDLRLNRLALLQRLAATMDKIADFSRIEG